MKTPESIVFLMVVTLSPGIASANNGKTLFDTQCTGCHQLGHNAYGPDLCGLTGRRAGTAVGYSYTQAMKDAGIVWNRESLQRFLRSPQTVVPGTRMGIIGFEDKNHRESIASYLLQVTHSSKACRQNR